MYGDLITKGRRTGSPHKTELTFWKDENKIYLLAHKRADGDTTDWVKNLLKEPSCKFVIGSKTYTCYAVHIGEDNALEEKIRDAFRSIGGNDHYNTWYKDTKRIPVVLEIQIS